MDKVIITYKINTYNKNVYHLKSLFFIFKIIIKIYMINLIFKKN